MTGHKHHPEPADAALRDIERLKQEGDVLGGMMRHAAGHFAATDAPPDDAIERWGRRIGRGLAVIAFIGLCVYLYLAHVR